MSRLLDVVGFKLEMLRPPFFDKDVVDKFDNTYGAHGFNLLLQILYSDLILGMSAISSDKSSNSPSIKSILKLLESKELIEALKTDFCKGERTTYIGPWDEDSKKSFKEREKDIRQGTFEEVLDKAKSLYKGLEKTELYKRIRKARNKTVAHYEMREDNSVIRQANLSDFSLEWELDDLEDYYNKIKTIIEKILLLTSGEHYDYEHSNRQHKDIAKDFWKRASSNP